MVALRKESVDRNAHEMSSQEICWVALRKESVDRNNRRFRTIHNTKVALRKESVDRNLHAVQIIVVVMQSLSARRAWIEMEGAVIGY